MEKRNEMFYDAILVLSTKSKTWSQTERFKANQKVKAVTHTTQVTRAVSSAETKAPADPSL